jgi:hypothetical protein
MIEGTISIFSITGRVGAKVTDEAVTQEVHSLHGLRADDGDYVKPLFPESICGEENSYTRFRKAISVASKWHYDHSFPWKKGEALVMADFLAEYDRVMKEQKGLVEAAGRAFFADAPRLIALVRAARNGTFKIEHYDKVTKQEKKFAFSITYAPVSEGSQFAKGIEAGLRRKLEAELEARNTQRLATIQAESWRRLVNPMEEFAARIQSPNFKPKSDSLEYVRSILALLPAMRSVDPELDVAARRLEDSLNTINPNMLNYQSTRAEVTAEVGEVVQRFGMRRRFSADEQEARKAKLDEIAGLTPPEPAPERTPEPADLQLQAA